MKKRKYGEGPDFSCKYTPAVRAVVGRVSDGVRTTVRTDFDAATNAWTGCSSIGKTLCIGGLASYSAYQDKFYLQRHARITLVRW